MLTSLLSHENILTDKTELFKEVRRSYADLYGTKVKSTTKDKLLINEIKENLLDKLTSEIL